MWLISFVFFLLIGKKLERHLFRLHWKRRNERVKKRKHLEQFKISFFFKIKDFFKRFYMHFRTESLQLKTNTYSKVNQKCRTEAVNHILIFAVKNANCSLINVEEITLIVFFFFFIYSYLRFIAMCFCFFILNFFPESWFDLIHFSASTFTS